MSADDVWLLVEPHRARLYRLARRRVSTREDAQDIAAEALLRVATYPALDPARVGPLLTAVTVRLCVDHARHLAAERRGQARLHVPAADDVADLLDAAEARWLATVTLTGVEAAALTARADGLLPADVAPLLGVSASAAKSALARARRKLLAAWRETLGIAGLRLRRLAPVAVGSVALFLALAPRTDIPVRAGTAQTPAASVSVTPPRYPAPAPASTVPTRPVPAMMRTEAPGSHSTVAPVPLLTYPSTAAGPVSQDGGAVYLDSGETPEHRVQRCLDNGVYVDPERAWVVCR